MAQLPSESLFGDYSEWPGRDVLDAGGERLGGVREIYLDRETGHPEWVLVDVDGDTSRFVPLADAQVGSATIQVAHTSGQIRSAPGIGTDSQIDQTEERRLYAHYGLGYSETDSGSGLPDDHAPVPEPPTSREETIASAAPPQTTWGTSDAHTETFQSAAPPEESAPAAVQPTGWGTSSPPPTPWGTPEPAEAASTEPETSSWSEAATNDAPPPAEPPTAAEIEAAHIPEPPATTERAMDFDAPAPPSEPETTAYTPPTEPEPPAAYIAPPIEPDTTDEPTAWTPPSTSEPISTFEAPAPFDTPTDPALDTPAETPPSFDTPVVAESPAVPPLTPTVSPSELAEGSLAPPVVPDEVLGAPEPDPITAAASVPPRPAQTERPAWTSPPPADTGGALALIKDRQVTIVVAAVIAAVLFFVVRRLR